MNKDWASFFWLLMLTSFLIHLHKMYRCMDVWILFTFTNTSKCLTNLNRSQQSTVCQLFSLHFSMNIKIKLKTTCAHFCRAAYGDRTMRFIISLFRKLNINETFMCAYETDSLQMHAEVKVGVRAWIIISGSINSDIGGHPGIKLAQIRQLESCCNSLFRVWQKEARLEPNPG